MLPSSAVRPGIKFPVKEFLMKRNLFAVTVIFFTALSQAPAQMAVIDAAAATLMKSTHAENIIYYGQMVSNMVTSAENTYQQLQQMVNAEKRALENLKGITNVNSFDEFMDWNNRQLELERRVGQSFDSLSIKIGSKNVKLTDIEGLTGAAKETFIDYWKQDMTPEQRRQLYLSLGMTPANYAYMTTWEQKEKDLAKLLLTKKEIIEKDDEEAAERNKKLREEAMKGENGEKAVLQSIFDILLDTNLVERKRRKDEAEARERELAAERSKEHVAEETPFFSESYGQDPFGSLCE